MKSLKAGETTLGVEVTNISQYGFWVMVDEKEYFLSFEIFPWFKNARVSEIERVSATHLFWNKLDIDLTLDIINNPDGYPLIYK
jgi:hypothetical protein